MTQADGPERLHGEWWRASGAEADHPFTVRDYYQIETMTCGRYWLFRIGDGENADRQHALLHPRRVRVKAQR